MVELTHTKLLGMLQDDPIELQPMKYKLSAMSHRIYANKYTQWNKQLCTEDKWVLPCTVLNASLQYNNPIYDIVATSVICIKEDSIVTQKKRVKTQGHLSRLACTSQAKDWNVGVSTFPNKPEVWDPLRLLSKDERHLCHSRQQSTTIMQTVSWHSMYMAATTMNNAHPGRSWTVYHGHDIFLDACNYCKVLDTLHPQNETHIILWCFWQLNSIPIFSTIFTDIEATYLLHETQVTTMHHTLHSTLIQDIAVCSQQKTGWWICLQRQTDGSQRRQLRGNGQVDCAAPNPTYYYLFLPLVLTLPELSRLSNRWKSARDFPDSPGTSNMYDHTHSNLNAIYQVWPQWHMHCIETSLDQPWNNRNCHPTWPNMHTKVTSTGQTAH